MYGFRRMVAYGVFGSALILCFVATPTFAATPSMVVDGGSNTITSLNQTTIVVSGNSGLDGIGGTFRSGTSTVTLVDSVGTILTAEKVFTSLDSKTYSLSFDTTSLVDGSITVSLETIATEGNTVGSLSVVIIKQTIASTPNFEFFILPSAIDSTECVSRSVEFLSYSSTTPTNKVVCALLSTTTAEVFSAINTNAHLFTANDSFVFTFNDSLGNTGANTVTVTNIDTTVPVISITTPENATTTGQTLTPSVSATDTNTVTLGCVLDGVSLADCVSLIGGLAGGNHTFTVNALDSAGNTSASSSAFTVAFANPLLSFVASSSPLVLLPIDQTATTTLQIASGTGTSTVAIPKGTAITRSDVTALSTADISLTTIDGSTLSNIATGIVVDGALQWGVPGVGLEFSEAITVNLYVGTSLNGTTLTVYRSLELTSGWTQNGLVSSTCVVANGLCSFSTTKASYFTSVHVPAPTPAPSGGGGGGGGGGGIIGGVSVSTLNINSSIVSTPTAVIATPVETVSVSGSVGSVLGASTYNFTRTLTVGSKGDDVKALQERLRDEGVYSGLITSYFGPVTKSAVKAYQEKNALPAVGIVGPMTREVLNKGVVQKTPTQTLSDAQVSAILELLQSFGADASVITNVSASLGKSLP
ncbi:MAG: peptidoglycan-binding domain-containing protein [Candidatus Paceibacterota bacterium]